MDTTYPTTREGLAEGAMLPQLSNAGGQLRVREVFADGSVRGVSDFGAVRTVPAEKVDRMLALAAAYQAS